MTLLLITQYFPVYTLVFDQLINRRPGSIVRYNIGFYLHSLSRQAVGKKMGQHTSESIGSPGNESFLCNARSFGKQ